MIDTGEIAGLAGIVEADQRTAVQAAILKCRNAPVFGAHHDNRHATNEGGAPVANIRDVAVDAQVVPDRAFKQTLLLVRKQRGVLIQVERNSRKSFLTLRVVGRMDGCLIHSEPSITCEAA